METRIENTYFLTFYGRIGGRKKPPKGLIWIMVNPLPPKLRRKRLSRLSPVYPSDVENVSGKKIILNAP